MTDRRIYIVGASSGTQHLLTPEAVAAIFRCGFIAAGKNLLPLAGKLAPGARIHQITADLEAALGFVASSAAQGDVCVLTSGDPGCFSIMPAVKERFPEATVIPGISSVQLLAARLGRPWQDWKLVSAHGRELGGDISGTTLVFCDDNHRPERIAARFPSLASSRAAVGTSLGREDEQVIEGTLAEIAAQSFAGGSVLLIDAPQGAGVPDRQKAAAAAPGIPDEMWLRAEGVPLSKAEVRCVLLGKARPAGRGVIWDVGAGTGSYGIECSLLEPAAQVISIDKNPAACHLVAANAERFGARVEVMCNAAPEAFEDLAPPDLVIVGGSEGMIEPIFKSALIALRPGGRIVVTALLDDTRKKAHRLFAASGLENRAGTRISIARGDAHKWREQNPVIVFTGDKAQS